MTEDKAQETGGLVGKSPNLIFKSWGKVEALSPKGETRLRNDKDLQ